MADLTWLVPTGQTARGNTVENARANKSDPSEAWRTIPQVCEIQR